MASMNVPQKRSRRITEQSSSHQGARSTRINNSNNEAAVSSTEQQQTSYGTDASGVRVLRFRTPHAHDVLSGRGGAINSHVGNAQFRKWIHDRRARYALAASKTEKARVAQEVIEIVRGQEPPGRFLQKDPACQGHSSAVIWWVELDEDHIIAKTSQALREGAPQIRAANGLVVPDKQPAISGRRKSHKPAATTTQQQQEQQLPPAIAAAASPTFLVSSMVPTAVINSSGNFVVNPPLSGQKRIHPGSETMPSSQQQQQHLQAAFLSLPEVMDRQASISELRVHMEEAKRQHDNSMQAQNQTDTRPLYPVPVAAAPPPAAAAAVPVFAAAPPPAMDPVTKRLRAEYGGTVVLPTDATPPLIAADVAEHKLDALPPLNLSHAQRASADTTANNKTKRSHSFSLSDTSPTDEWATSDFVNPFEDEGTTPPGALNQNHHHHHADLDHNLPPPGTVYSSLSLWHQRPRPGVYHEESRAATTSDEDDLVALGALVHAPTVVAAPAVQSAPTPPNTAMKESSASTHPQSAASAAADSTSNKAWVRVRSNLSSRSLTSILSDLPDEFNCKPLETEFSQGMKVIYNALHQEEDAIIPT